MLDAVEGPDSRRGGGVDEHKPGPYLYKEAGRVIEGGRFPVEGEG